MRHATSASVSFDVGHASPYPSTCLRSHGHRVRIEIAAAGTPTPGLGSYVIDPDVLVSALAAIRAELEHRDLIEMIAPAKPTAAGLAGWVWERVALNLGALSHVEVSLGDISARVSA